jgi:zinc and cadmium transporter
VIWIWVLAMVAIDGAAGLAGAAIPESWLERYRAPLLGFATGALLASGLGELLPESFETLGAWALAYTAASAALLVVVEHYFARRTRRRGPVAPIALLGSDALHNIGDGMAIAAAFLGSTHLGVVTSFAVIVHEVPEEIADYALLRASGIDKRNALLALAGVQLTAALGAIGTLVASSVVTSSVGCIDAIAAGTFAYIALVDLAPELVRMRSGWAVVAAAAGAGAVLVS